MHTHKYACSNVCVYVERDRIRVKQRAVRYTQKSKQTEMHTCVSVYVWLYDERERISVTLVTTAAQGFLSDLYVRVRVCAGTISLISPLCLFVCRCTPTHPDTKTHRHTQATQKTQANRWQVMIENQHCYSSTVSQYSATRNTHSLKRWKLGKNVRWQGRQLVVVQMKMPVSRRNRELVHQL
jgi:hypothetical protein